MKRSFLTRKIIFYTLYGTFGKMHFIVFFALEYLFGESILGTPIMDEGTPFKDSYSPIGWNHKEKF